MARVLRLSNTFRKSIIPVELAAEPLTVHGNNNELFREATFYICGPTVHSDTHIGHALTYVRADLFRRFLKSVFNVKLHTLMNITDIDDKILVKAQQDYTHFPSDPAKHPFNLVAAKYLKSFNNDMDSLRVQPPDLSVKVSKQMQLITAFIAKLEKLGHTYLDEEGNLRFKVDSVPSYIGRKDPRQQSTQSHDSRDFVLWKLAKQNEPVWTYERPNGQKIPGRPGWHIQCSALSSALFGKRLDFHFGGKDLIFPHHYNEEACSCAFHQLDTSQSIHVWSSHWLHSGHLVYKDEKMSKSLGNTISIQDLLHESSINIIRLLCITSHYRSDITFDQSLIKRLASLDTRVASFVSYLVDILHRRQEILKQDEEESQIGESETMRSRVFKTQSDILDGICDDFHLDVGLECIIGLSKEVYALHPDNLRTRDLLTMIQLLRDWCNSCGLKYESLNMESSQDTSQLMLLNEFRQKVRTLAINEIKSKTSHDASVGHQLLKECDNLRSSMTGLGIAIRDSKA